MADTAAQFVERLILEMGSGSYPGLVRLLGQNLRADGDRGAEYNQLRDAVTVAYEAATAE